MAISRLTRQAGLTLLEVLVSLGILATVTTGIVALTNQQSEKTKASVVALHTKMVGTAAAEYIKENYSTILSTATTTQPVLIRVSDMISSGKLQAGFNPKNARGQDTCVLVLKQSATNLTSLLVTEGGEVIDDLSLGQIASEIGAAGSHSKMLKLFQPVREGRCEFVGGATPEEQGANLVLKLKEAKIL